MTDEITAPQLTPSLSPQKGIMDKTFGEIINNNLQAQNIIMKAMHIDQQKLQEMIKATGGNEIMNMTIRDMFKNGIMQQAASSQTVQVSPEQMQQITQAMQNNQGQLTPEQLQQITGRNVAQGQVTQAGPAVPQKQTFLQKLKGLF